MRKRGISDVIAIVLIVLISLITISILWIFIQPSITQILGSGENQGEITKFVFCADISLKADTCTFNESAVKIKISREVGSGEIYDIAFQFDGSRVLFIKESILGDIPGEFDSSNFVFGSENFARAPSNARVTVIFRDGAACEFDDIPIKCEPETPLSFECGNGIIEFGEQCDDGNTNNGDGCSSMCQLEGQLGESCEDFGTNVIYLSDFNENTCTRTRFGLLSLGIDKIPSAGIRIVGNDYNNAKNAGASFGRDLIQWYTMYGLTGEGELDFSSMDAKMAEYKVANMKVILTLRVNHPTKSEVGFETGGRTLFEPDSYPKDITEWTEYLQAFADRYYVNPAPEYAGVLAAIQIGNEWGHQFEINESYGRWNSNQRDEAILSLQNISYNAIKEIAPRLPVVAFAVSGTPAFTLGAGYNEDGWIYNGQYYDPALGRKNGISIIRQEDVGQNTVDSFRRAMVNGSPYYDYFDAHIYFQNPEEARYVANFVRDTWKDNGITGKGLISTEFAVPIYNYSYDWHSYTIKVAQAVAYHAGFDAITWGNWNPSPGMNLLQTSLKTCGEINSNCYQTWQVNNYSYFSGLSKDFSKVKRQGELFSFATSAGNNDFNISLDIPAYPGLRQCLDGLDNDNDGLIDLNDVDCLIAHPDCGSGNNIRQDLSNPNCIDPLGFSENNWVFTFGN